MKESFISWNPSKRSEMLLVEIDRVLTSYQQQGYVLTLRQLYYQLVAQAVIPNTVSSYNSLGNVVNKGRLSGYIDWRMIEDRVRVPRENTHWISPGQILKAAADSYYLDRWKNQDYYIEVWCEKDAVSNIIQPVCSRWDVLFLANRGYSSQTAMYDASNRFINNDDKDCVLFYLGDHDPSGIDMTRDIEDRMMTFGVDVDVIRLALNMSQVNQYNPPRNPAKITDTRYGTYVDQFGDDSWELDALEPKVLEQIVEGAISSYANVTEMKRVEKEESKVRDRIKEIAEAW